MTTRKLIVKLGSNGRNLRTEREIDGDVTQDDLEQAADAAVESLGLPTKRADRLGKHARAGKTATSQPVESRESDDT